ncbi:MAG TPA: hypothetical protein VGD95_05625 [Micavibrio sp.]
MTSIFKKAAVTLASALATAGISATASADPGYQQWFGPHMRQHFPTQPHYYKAPPQHRYEPSPREKCENALYHGRPLTQRFRHTAVGFIEGRSFACKINLNTGRLTSSYNLQTYSGVNSYQNALHHAARNEERTRHDRYRDLSHW